MRWVPNAITLLRAAAVVGVIALLEPGGEALALLVFAFAAATDAIDGPLARGLGATSRLGALLDPLADKVLVLGTLAGLVAREAVDPLAVGLILAREVGVTAVRAVAAGRGAIVGSNAFGKAKAALQGAAVGAQIAALAWPSLALGVAADALLWAAAVATVATGAEVIRRAAATLGAPAALRAHAH